MGGSFSAECQHGTHDVTSWGWTRQCSANDGFILRSNYGKTLIEKGAADDNCNIQHAPDSCWGLYTTKTDVDGNTETKPVYCIDDKWAVKPQPYADTFTNKDFWDGACSDGCTEFCPEPAPEPEVPPDVPEPVVCTWTGEFMGEIQNRVGEALSEKLPLEEAQAVCEGLEKCIGVDADWYTGAPFVARAGTFRTDRSSYGLTYLKRCGDEVRGSTELPTIGRRSTGLEAGVMSISGAAVVLFGAGMWSKQKKHVPLKRLHAALSSSFSFGGKKDEAMELV